MKKRIKAQRMKLMKMMQGYAILCLGTQFNLTDVHSTPSDDTGGKSKKSNKGSDVRIATSEMSRTLEARTSSILGSKFLSGLTRFEIDLSSAVMRSLPSTTLLKNNDDNGECSSRWKLVGLISHAPSSPNHPSTARELQFFSINARPVDLPTVTRVIGDVWRMFDPSESTAGGGGRRRPACVLSFTLPNSMYDVNLSPDKREVMFTEEEAMSALIREGLMTLWLGQTEGKFEANEVESRSNKCSTYSGAADNGSKTATNSSAKCNSDENTFGSSRVNEHALPPVDAKVDHKRIDYVTPTLRRRSVDESGRPLVTPFDSGQSNELIEESGGLQTSVPSISVENTLQSKDEESDMLDLDDELIHRDKVQQSESSWTQMKLVERAREQDRRGWEQMRLNFRRIDNARIRQDLDILPPSNDRDDDVVDDEVVGKSNTRHKESSTTIHGSTIKNADILTNARPSKRRKRQDAAAFLDSFAYGSATLTESQDDADSDSQSSDDEMGRNKNKSVQGRLSRSRDNANTTRMIVGRRVTAKNHPRQSTRMIYTDEDRILAEPYEAIEDQHVDHFDNKIIAAPDEVVWNSFAGTQQVINQSLNARLVMQKNRKYLQTLMKRKRENIDTNNASEEVDSTVNLKREDFVHMSIIGQFNLGFVLARCRNQNLWILDQHACDEKYNFERLCKETVIHEQKLIAPLPLELSPSEEHCVLEHEDIFEQNGFRFSYDPEKEPRHRLSLTALPHSGSGGDGKKAVQFGKEDVNALCAILGADGTSSSAGLDTGSLQGGVRIAGVNAVRRYAGRSDGVVGPSIVRLPKAIAMFASRACRGSIMIGTALSEKEHMNILNKLDKTDIPWNCAHGRPTMSHIRSLIECLIDDDNVMLSFVAGPCLTVMDDV
jgi:DNA mismatch repair protein PMS2